MTLQLLFIFSVGKGACVEVRRQPAGAGFLPPPVCFRDQTPALRPAGKLSHLATLTLDFLGHSKQESLSHTAILHLGFFTWKTKQTFSGNLKRIPFARL